MYENILFSSPLIIGHIYISIMISHYYHIILLLNKIGMYISVTRISTHFPIKINLSISQLVLLLLLVLAY